MLVVLADALTEAGDPRGELIAMQIAPQTPAIARKSAKLVKAHLPHLLGPLAPVVRDVEFRRGFLARAKLAAPAGKTVGDPLWATVEHLEGKPVTSVLVEHPVMKSLRSLGMTDLGIAKLASYDWLEALMVHLFDHREVFEKSGNFPALRELTVHMSYVHSCDYEIADLVKCSILERLSKLAIDVAIGTDMMGTHGLDEGDLESLPSWLERAAELRVPEVTLATAQGKVVTRYRFTPDGATVTIPKFPKRDAAELRASVEPMIEIVRRLRSNVEVIEPVLPSAGA